MARKSLDRRLSETRTTYSMWIEAGMENDRAATFMRDMIARMERKKGMSTGQRKFLDNLIEKGAPQLHNVDRCALIDEAMSVAGMELSTQPLTDFRYKLSKGWSLSEKQEAYLAGLLEKAESLKAGLPVLDDTDKWLLEQLIAYGYGRGDYYWQHRPGHYRTWQNAMHFYETHGTLLENDFNRLKNAFKGASKVLQSPRFPEGSLASYKKEAVVVIGRPYAITGSRDMLQDVLKDGAVVAAVEKNLRKRLTNA